MIALDTAPVFYAGEAFSRPWQATAHGAYVTGADAAHKAASLLGRAVAGPDYEWLPDG